MVQTEKLSFDRVEQLRYEAAYDEVANCYEGPMSKHPVISVKGHPEIIWVRPDMGIGAVGGSLAFAAGSPARQIPWREVKRSLKDGYLPIVNSEWRCGPLLFQQTSFAALVRGGEVRSGHEKQVFFVEMKISSIGPVEAQDESLWVFVPGAVAAKGIPPFPYNTYDLFEVVGELPSMEGRTVDPEDQVLRDDSRTLGIYQADHSMRPQSQGRGLHFPVKLRPNEQKSIHFAVTSSARGLDSAELAMLKGTTFSSALDQRVRDLHRILEMGMQIDVPDKAVNNIYRAQILDYQSQVLQAAGRDYSLPVQGYQGVWPWEAMKLTTHLDSIGHHEDVRKCIDYFLKIQGRFPPHGSFKNSAGCFGGTIAFEESGWEEDAESTLCGQLAKINAGKESEFPNWMNGTGAILYAAGVHFRYTRDRAWLERVAPAMIRACDWIITERQVTKKLDAHGEKVLHFGLLPIGRAYDTAEEAIRQLTSEGKLSDGPLDDRQAPLDTYYPCFTDAYSSQGLSSMADALAEIGHPEGPRLLREAEAYREDILEVMRRTRTTDPHLPPYPERLNRPPAWAEFATGALSYLDTGFMEPRSAAFEQLENYMKPKWNKGVLGLTGAMEKNGDPLGDSTFYVNFSEDIWHRGWLLRGEIEKALLAFYSMLAYGMDKQTLATVERFNLKNPRYAPFFMDTSASARVCGLIRQTLLLEEDRVLYLLAGVPRRWLETGETITVKAGIAVGVKLNLRVVSNTDGGTISLDLVLSDLRPAELESLRIRVPHPSRQPMKRVTVNGKTWDKFDRHGETIDLIPASGRTEIDVLY